MSTLRQNITATTAQMSAGTPNGSITPETLSSLVYFALPIIFLWMAMKSTEKMSKELSSAATEQGMKFGKWIGRQPWRATKGTAKWLGVTGGVQQAWKNRKGLFGSDSRLARESREDRIARILSGSGIAGRKAAFDNAADDAKDKRVNAELSHLKKFGNVSTARGQLQKGNADQKAAAALYLADKKAFRDANEMNSALKAVGNDRGAATKIIDGAPEVVLEEKGALVGMMRTLKENKLHSVQENAIAKFKKEGLGTSGDDYRKVIEALDDGSGSEENKRRKEALSKKYNKQLASEGQSHVQYEYELEQNGGNRTQAYGKVFGKMSVENIAKQNEDFLRNEDSVSYLAGLGRDKRKQLMVMAARGGTSDKVAQAWQDGGVAPVASSDNKERGKFRGTSGASAQNA